MQMTKYYGEILSDGHLTLPGKLANKIGKKFEVILIPADNEEDIYKYAKKLAKKKGFKKYNEKDIEKIIHESRSINK